MARLMRRSWRGASGGNGEGRAALLIGVVQTDGTQGRGVPAGVSVAAFRDLGALIADTTYARISPDPQRVAEYRGIIESVFAERSILPAPFGTVFRDRDALIRWLELHYFTLIEALTFVEDRVMARVSLAHPPLPPDARDAGTSRAAHADVEAAATESFRLLRRHAVASLSSGKPHADEVRGAFLVDRDKWGLFGDVVKEEQKRLPDLTLSVTGPWPPYDFVRMDFGG